MSFGWLIKKIRSLFSKNDSNEQELYAFILETFREMKSEVLSAKIVYSQFLLLEEIFIIISFYMEVFLEKILIKKKWLELI